MSYEGPLNVPTLGERRHGADRRVRRISLRYPDRRSGFERRRPVGGALRGAHRRMLDAYRESPRALARVLALVVILNTADLLLTLRALSLGAGEANPVMGWLLTSNPMLAGLFKVSVGAAAALAMWSMRRYRRVLEASLWVAGGLGLLVAYHAIGLAVLAA